MGPIITVYLESCQKNEEVSFYTDMSLGQFNIFRRIILCEVPTLALDLFEMIDNDSNICNEVLVERISLIPLKYHAHEKLVRKDLCDCSVVCEKCSIIIPFKGKQGGWLMSEDISELLLANIPIVYLAKSHRVNFNVVATRGVATWHSKWSLGVVISMKVINRGLLKVLLRNTGTYSFDYILREVFSIMQSKLNIEIVVK